MSSPVSSSWSRVWSRVQRPSPASVCHRRGSSASTPVPTRRPGQPIASLRQATSRSDPEASFRPGVTQLGRSSSLASTDLRTYFCRLRMAARRGGDSRPGQEEAGASAGCPSLFRTSTGPGATPSTERYQACGRAREPVPETAHHCNTEDMLGVAVAKWKLPILIAAEHASLQ